MQRHHLIETQTIKPAPYIRLDLLNQHTQRQTKDQPVRSGSPHGKIRVKPATPEPGQLLTAASDDDESVTFGDDVKSPRVHVRAGLGVFMLSRSSSCCRGLAGMAAPP